MMLATIFSVGFIISAATAAPTATSDFLLSRLCETWSPLGAFYQTDTIPYELTCTPTQDQKTIVLNVRAPVDQERAFSHIMMGVAHADGKLWTGGVYRGLPENYRTLTCEDKTQRVLKMDSPKAVEVTILWDLPEDQSITLEDVNCRFAIAENDETYWQSVDVPSVEAEPMTNDVAPEEILLASTEGSGSGDLGSGAEPGSGDELFNADESGSGAELGSGDELLNVDGSGNSEGSGILTSTGDDKFTAGSEVVDVPPEVFESTNDEVATDRPTTQYVERTEPEVILKKDTMKTVMGKETGYWCDDALGNIYVMAPDTDCRMFYQALMKEETDEVTPLGTFQCSPGTYFNTNSCGCVLGHTMYCPEPNPDFVPTTTPKPTETKEENVDVFVGQTSPTTAPTVDVVGEAQNETETPFVTEENVDVFVGQTSPTTAPTVDVVGEAQNETETPFVTDGAPAVDGETPIDTTNDGSISNVLVEEDTPDAANSTDTSNTDGVPVETVDPDTPATGSTDDSRFFFTEGLNGPALP